jgi:hypothetical protein
VLKGFTQITPARKKTNMFELKDKPVLTQGNSTKVHQKV